MDGRSPGLIGTTKKECTSLGEMVEEKTETQKNVYNSFGLASGRESVGPSI
jgi:hypothetical protein